MFKDTIKALRKERGLTQTELGEVVGFTHVAVVKWENGQREPDFSTLIKLADYFGVSTDYLLGREEKKSVIERPTSEIAVRYKHLFEDPDFVKVATVYDSVQLAAIKGLLVGYFLAAAKSSGVDTSIVGY